MNVSSGMKSVYERLLFDFFPPFIRFFIAVVFPILRSLFWLFIAVLVGVIFFSFKRAREKEGKKGNFFLLLLFSWQFAREAKLGNELFPQRMSLSKHCRIFYPCLNV